MDDNDIFSRFQAGWKGIGSAKDVELKHLVHILWVRKLKKRSNSSFLEILILGMLA